jgi:hypothetical protein
MDIGDQTKLCNECGAIMWSLERVDKRETNNTPIFSLCCRKGKITLPSIQDPPQLLSSLLHGHDVRSKHFMERIRGYNMMFAFTSMGGQVDKTVNMGRGPYVFRVRGQTCHRIGSLLPEESSSAKFQQLYIVDTENEIENRKSAVRYQKQYIIKLFFFK